MQVAGVAGVVGAEMRLGAVFTVWNDHSALTNVHECIISPPGNFYTVGKVREQKVGLEGVDMN